MRPEIASLQDRMAQGGDWRAFQQEIADLHMQASTEAEYVVLLEAHRNLVAVGEQCFDAETYAKILPIALSEYRMFLNKEAMEDDLINPTLLARIAEREIAAGRLDADDSFAQLARAGTILGDSSELTAHRCNRGTWLFYGFAAAAILAWLAARIGVSPLWLILVGLAIGWVMNDHETKRIKAEIANRRAAAR